MRCGFAARRGPVAKAGPAARQRLRPAARAAPAANAGLAARPGSVAKAGSAARQRLVHSTHMNLYNGSPISENASGRRHKAKAPYSAFLVHLQRKVHLFSMEISVFTPRCAER